MQPKLNPAIVMNALIEKLYSRKWIRSQPLRLPQSRIKCPVKVGVSTERDNTPEFRRKLRLAGIRRRALDSSVA